MKLNHILHSVKGAFIVSACRTPFGSMGGALSSLTASELGAIAVRNAFERTKLDSSLIDEVYMGAVYQGGQGQDMARQTIILNKYPVDIVSTTFNKACASGMKTITTASQALMLGHQHIMICGGMESMSNVPFILKRNAVKYGGFKMEDGILYDGLTDIFSGRHMGECTEGVIKKHNITRKEQDDYAISSYTRSKQAWENNIFKDEVIPIEVKDRKGKITKVEEDEEYRRVNFEKFGKLRAVFTKDGTITAANASTLNDGAGAVVLMSEDALIKFNIEPLARIVSFADSCVEPENFALAPGKGIPIALTKAGLTTNQISMWEINEAFSAVAVVNTKLLDLDPTKVNMHGGAVSLGHPVGASGTRITGHLVHQLKKNEFGCASICNGGGGATTIILEKM
ncbi:hypothetical protein SNEBB_004567 [Seison nebaliae]|nr:hypothetical protein SNEBB_004567 [Seison nebaliae]